MVSEYVKTWPELKGWKGDLQQFWITWLGLCFLLFIIVYLSYIFDARIPEHKQALSTVLLLVA